MSPPKNFLSIDALPGTNLYNLLSSYSPDPPFKQILQSLSTINQTLSTLDQNVHQQLGRISTSLETSITNQTTLLAHITNISHITDAFVAESDGKWAINTARIIGTDGHSLQYHVNRIEDLISQSSLDADIVSFLNNRFEQQTSGVTLHQFLDYSPGLIVPGRWNRGMYMFTKNNYQLQTDLGEIYESPIDYGSV